MLQNDLNEEGLEELAEMLEGTEELDEQMRAELERLTANGNGLTGVRFDPRDGGNLFGRLLLVSAELQSRIQEMILLEISADRDAPVPASYRRAVDQYFRTLAGEADAMDGLSSKSNQDGENDSQMTRGGGESR